MIKASLERCQPWRVKKARCRLCVEACPLDGCISFSENVLSINREICNGCGICAAACPAGALALDGLDDGELINRVLPAAKGKKILFTCSLGPDKDSSIDIEKGSEAFRLNCLAMANESVLAGLALSGVEGISLDTSRCQGCGFKKGRHIIERSVRYAENLLSALGLGGRVDLYRCPEKDIKKAKANVKDIEPGPVYSRRELFSFLRGRAANPGNAMEQKDGANDLTPARRRVLTEALKNAHLPGGDVLMGKEDFPVRALAIGEGCTLCRRCAAFCPTGALKRVETDAEARIDFNAGLCMGCFECREFCPTGALKYVEEVSLQEMTGKEATLSRKRTEGCQSCGARYLPETVPGCPACGKRDRLEKRIRSMMFGERA